MIIANAQTGMRTRTARRAHSTGLNCMAGVCTPAYNISKQCHTVFGFADAVPVADTQLQISCVHPHLSAGAVCCCVCVAAFVLPWPCRKA